MTTCIPDCMGNYNLENIAYFGKKRLIELDKSIDLVSETLSCREREELTMVTYLTLDDNGIADLKLECRYSHQCKTTNCYNLLRKIINEDLKTNKNLKTDQHATS